MDFQVYFSSLRKKSFHFLSFTVHLNRPSPLHFPRLLSETRSDPIFFVAFSPQFDIHRIRNRRSWGWRSSGPESVASEWEWEWEAGMEMDREEIGRRSTPYMESRRSHEHSFSSYSSMPHFSGHSQHLSSCISLRS